ncbi:MAG: N-acetylglucosamine-6-phosphate deacetylase [Proteobacteria bacterium]|nr:N-acetylglucosamine-6-phosphate deacetylase [Pseudomonadota bacterium]
MRQLLHNCRVFDGECVHDDLAVLVSDGKVLELVAAGQKATAAVSVDLSGNLLAPGLIDLQINGGGGVLFNDAPSVDTLVTIAAAHRPFGTTAFLATLISDDDTVMERGIAAVKAAISQGLPGVLGIHLEGPYLNPQRKGVHDAAKIRGFDEQMVELLSSLHHGSTLLTVAPEKLPVRAITTLTERGVVVFGGHSAATYAQTRAALDAGLRGFTHLFNAMEPLQSREPGMVGAALEDANSYIGIIADGYHVHPATFSVAIAAKAAGKSILISDAMPSVGASEKSFWLNGERIEAGNGRCTTADGRLAGSDIGMIEAVRNASRFANIDSFEALRMGSAYVANALGVDDRLGYIRPGYRANFIELDESFAVVSSWIDGERQVHR